MLIGKSCTLSSQQESLKQVYFHLETFVSGKASVVLFVPAQCLGLANWRVNGTLYHSQPLLVTKLIDSILKKHKSMQYVIEKYFQAQP